MVNFCFDLYRCIGWVLYELTSEKISHLGDKSINLSQLANYKLNLKFDRLNDIFKQYIYFIVFIIITK